MLFELALFQLVSRLRLIQYFIDIKAEYVTINTQIIMFIYDAINERKSCRVKSFSNTLEKRR